MAERDKVIKSGQLTLPRIAFLVLAGAILWAIVYFGGVFLSIGYWLLTLAICGLLFLIAMDYGVKMDKVDLSGQPLQTATAEVPAAAAPRVTASMGEARPKKRGSRPVKRRR